MKNSSRKYLIVILLLLALAGLMGFRMWDVWTKKAEVGKEIQDLSEEVARLKEEQTAFEEKTKDFQTLGNLEKMAKQNLDLKRSGEVVLRLPEEEVVLPKVEDEKSKSFLDFFKKIFN